MGTRHLICVVVDGEIKVAQYGQWDGYPSGQGNDIREFVKELGNGLDAAAFRQKVKRLTEITEEEMKALWEECGASPEAEWVDASVADLFGERYPHLSRDAGAKILRMIADRDDVDSVMLSTEFAANGLFCEWAYVLDLDEDVLEVYEGFQKGNCEGRFADMKPPKDNGYQPVSLVAKFPFGDMPDSGEFCRMVNEAAGKEPVEEPEPEPEPEPKPKPETGRWAQI
jgi:hypothetical protein